MIKKWILAIAGLSFAFVFTSCDEQAKQTVEATKVQKEERHHRKW